MAHENFLLRWNFTFEKSHRFVSILSAYSTEFPVYMIFRSTCFRTLYINCKISTHKVRFIWGQFHKHLLDAFTPTDPQNAKNTDGLTIFFALLGSVCTKASRKMLMTLTPGNVKLGPLTRWVGNGMVMDPLRKLLLWQK